MYDKARFAGLRSRISLSLAAVRIRQLFRLVPLMLFSGHAVSDSPTDTLQPRVCLAVGHKHT